MQLSITQKNRFKALISILFFTVVTLLAVFGLNANKVQAAPWEVAPDYTFSPMPSGQNTLRGVRGATYRNSFNLEGDKYDSYSVTNGQEAIYANTGWYNGAQTDMHISVTNLAATGIVSWNKNKLGFMLDERNNVSTPTWRVFNGAGGYQSRDQGRAQLHIWFTVAGTDNRINFNSQDTVALAFTEIEPSWFRSGGQTTVSFNQAVTTITQPIRVGPFTNDTIINVANATAGYFQSTDGANVPTNKHRGQNFINDYDASSAVAVYRPGAGNIDIWWTGYSSQADLLVLNGRAAPPAPQSKPTKAVSLEENANYGTSKTITNTEAPYYYSVKQGIKYDATHNGTGFKIVDDLPVGAKIQDVVANSSAWNISFSGRHFEATAKKDIYKAPGSYEFKIKAVIDDTITTTNRTIYNTATNYPTGGAQGGGNSNTVDVTVPVPKQPAPEKDVSVIGPNSGWTRPKESIKTISQPFFYKLTQEIKRDPWTNGKGITITDTLPEGTKINRIRTENPNEWDIKYSGRTFTATSKVDVLKHNSKFTFYIDAQTSADIKESVTQLFNTAETHILPGMSGGGKSNTVEVDIPREKKDINADIDWIMLDTKKASNKQFPMQYRWHYRAVASEPLVNTKGLTGQALIDATATNKWFKDQLDSIRTDTKVKNETTGSNQGYEETKSFRQLQSDDKGNSNPKVLRTNVALKDDKLSVDKNNMIKFNLDMSGAPGLRLQSAQKATTYINTASEKVFTNKDLKNDKISYTNQVRTLYDVKADKLNSYKESFDFNFTTKVNQKTGYYDISDMKFNHHSDIDHIGRMKDYTTTLPASMLDDYKGTDAKINHKTGQISMEKSDEKTVNEASRTTVPDLADLTKWQGKGYNVYAHYPHAYSEVRNGNIFTADQVKKGDKEIKSNLVDGGNRLYLPVWLKVGDYKGKYNLEDAKGVKGELGENAISFKFEKSFDAFAQMYSDEKSGTKKTDELYVQPVFANADYKNVKGLTSAGKRWVTSVNTENGQN